MGNKLRLLMLVVIVTALPLTIFLAKQIQNYINFAAEPERKMALGISLPYGFASNDSQTDAQIAEIEKFASPVASGGVGAYPASYSIWTNFTDDGTWKYGSRNKFPNQKLLNYLDSKKITPMIFMAPVGSGMRKNLGTIESARKYSNESIASGAWDAYFIEWAQAAKAYGKPVVLRYAWEMNGTWFPWSPYTTRIGNTYYDVGNTPENYVAAWRHIYNVVKPIAPNVQFYWCPNLVTTAPNEKMASFYPGNNYVDYVGFDAYNWNPKQTPNNTLSSIYGVTIQALRHVQTGSTTTLSPKPIIVGETGLLIGNELRVEKLNYGTIYNTYPDLKSIVYFDIDPSYLFGAREEPGNSWRLSGKSDDPEYTTQGIDLRPKYNTFVVQEKFMGNLNPNYESTNPAGGNPTSILTAPPTSKPTNTPTPKPTNSPTPKTTNTPSPTPTKIPTPTPTPIVTATPQETILKFNTVKLHGIGRGGDNTNPTLTGNTNPITTTKALTVELYDSTGTLAKTVQGNVVYNAGNGYFSGSIKLDSTINALPYLVKVKTDKYLRKQLSKIITIQKGTSIDMPEVTLVAGDSNGDGKLDIDDYNVVLDCYSDFLNPKNCADPSKKSKADLSDDGKVNQDDYNLFLRELSVVSGD